MKIDMHCHVIGHGLDMQAIDQEVYFNPQDNNLLFTRALYYFIENELEEMAEDAGQEAKISTKAYMELIYGLLKSSKEIEGIVFLGLDAVYAPDTGDLDKTRTDLWVGNRFLANRVAGLNAGLQAEAQDKRFFFGASVSPNRRDWEQELEFVASRTEAVCLKWIPSVQHIRVNDPKHKKFYKALAAYRLPLLCHVGPEYSFAEGIRNREWDDFRFLELPLECGVTVIAAHCAAPVFPLVDKNEIEEFFLFMQKANTGGKIQLWSDTSGLSLATRLAFMREIQSTFPAEWLLHGSDFPIPIDAWPHLPVLVHEKKAHEYLPILKNKNPFDKDVQIKRAYGFQDRILENAEKVLRICKPD
jgi:predicted TIM-barrel fold metal-dependent hydrolase